MLPAIGPAPRLSPSAASDTQSIPQPGNENVRINLWLNQARPPSNGQVVELCRRKFRIYSSDLILSTWLALQNSSDCGNRSRKSSNID